MKEVLQSKKANSVLINVSKRDFELVPTAPPGMNDVIMSR